MRHMYERLHHAIIRSEIPKTDLCLQELQSVQKQTKISHKEETYAPSGSETSR
jgi:hypothetical protein